MVDEQQIKGDPRMKKAYEASSQLLRKRLAKERPEDLELLDDIKESDIIVVTGQYDHAQVNFELAGIPHIVIDPLKMNSIEITPDKLLFINCPGTEIEENGITTIKRFVESGGMLVTTDWVLKNVLEVAFPGYVKFNDRSTVDDVFRIEILEVGDDSFVHKVIDQTDDPQWWLEGSSYPIQILDKEKVKILVTSKEMEEKYGEAPIVVSFKFGMGEIIHMTSHFYLQRTETRTERHALSSKTYAMEKGFSKAEAEEISELEDLSVSEVESAYTSQAIMTDLVTQQKKRVLKRQKEHRDEKEK